MNKNNLPVPEHIQSIVDTIMADNRARFGGWTMSLSTDEALAPGGVQPPPVATVPDPDKVFTKADIEAAVEKARSQEKDKLYGRLTGLEAQVTEVNQREQERIAAEQTAREAAEASARKAAEETMSARELFAVKEKEFSDRLAQVQSETEQRLSQITQERENERALLEKEREFATLQAYTQKRLAEESDSIAPQLVDFINGRSTEEIESSISVAKAKSAEIAEQVRAGLQAAQAQQRGTSVTGFAPVGPMEIGNGQRQYSAADIQNMDMAEYAKFRQQAGVGNGSGQNRGMFG